MMHKKTLLFSLFILSTSGLTNGQSIQKLQNDLTTLEQTLNMLSQSLLNFPPIQEISPGEQTPNEKEETSPPLPERTPQPITTKEQKQQTFLKLKEAKEQIQAQQPVIPLKKPKAQPTPVEPEKILFSDQNTVQLETETSSDSLSGYHALYYALRFNFNNKPTELLTAFIGTNRPLVIKHRIEQAFKDEVLGKNLTDNYLIKEENLPTKNPFMGVTPTTCRSIFYAVLRDSAGEEAKKYTLTKYEWRTKKKIELIDKPFTLKGQALLDDMKNVINTKRDFYLKQHKVSNNALNAIINDPMTVKQYTNIKADDTFTITRNDVLQGVKRKYKLEESTFDPNKKEMPEGKYLKEDDITALYPHIAKQINTAKDTIANQTEVMDDIGILTQNPTQLDENAAFEFTLIKSALEERAKKPQTAFIINTNYQFGKQNIVPIWMMIGTERKTTGMSYTIAQWNNKNMLNSPYTKIIQQHIK